MRPFREEAPNTKVKLVSLMEELDEHRTWRLSGGSSAR